MTSILLLSSALARQPSDYLRRPWLTNRIRLSCNAVRIHRKVQIVPGGAAERSRGAYLPFGVGPRNCIGQFLALRELVITLAELARGVEVDRIDDAPVAPHFNGTLKPAGDIPVSFRERAR
jgi:cytochrome P450